MGGNVKRSSLEAQCRKAKETSNHRDTGERRGDIEGTRCRLSSGRCCGGLGGSGSGGSCLDGCHRSSCGSGGCGSGGCGGQGACGSAGSGCAVDLGLDRRVEGTGHASQSERMRERGERLRRIGRILVGGRAKLDEIHDSTRSNVGDGIERDGSDLADVLGRSDVLEAGLLDGTAGAEVDGADTDGTERRGSAIVVPVDGARSTSSTGGSSNRCGDEERGRNL